MKEAFVTSIDVSDPFTEELDRPGTNGNTLKDKSQTFNNKEKERIGKLERMLKVCISLIV